MRVAAPAKAEFNSLCTDWAAMISVTLLVMLKAKLMGAG
jgi:tRNA A37 threonylcarbamoyltransferase TsaD